jgi:proline dehydrogenase
MTALEPGANAGVVDFAAGYAEHLDGWRDRISVAPSRRSPRVNPTGAARVDNQRMASDRSGWGAARGQPPIGLGTAALLRHALLWASGQRGVQRAVSGSPLTRRLVRRFVAGERLGEAVTVTRRLAGRGLLVTVDHLGEDTRDATAAAAAVAVYEALIRRISAEGLAAQGEVSLKLSALGQALDGELAFENARSVCRTAGAAGIAVTLDMEGHATTDSTLGIGRRLRSEFPSTGLVIQASLRRSEDDCRALAHPGSRVRLCKGAYQEPVALAWQRRDDIRAAYLRCLGILVAGGALPLLATHDPALIDACHRLMIRLGPGVAHEHQMLFGIRGDEQLRLAAAGEAVRIYVPFGRHWYPYLMRRMAERPANLALVLRALGGG